MASVSSSRWSVQWMPMASCISLTDALPPPSPYAATPTATPQTPRPGTGHAPRAMVRRPLGVPAAEFEVAVADDAESELFSAEADVFAYGCASAGLFDDGRRLFGLPRMGYRVLR